MSLHMLLRIVHLLGVLGFVAAHGATATVTFKLPKESDPARVRALLDLSRATRGLMYVSFVLLVGGGVGAGFTGHWWHAGWIWTSLGLFAVLFVAAFPIALPYFRAIREVVDAEPVDRDRLRKLLTSPRGSFLAWFETIGILIVFWLMVMKPF